MTFQDEIIAGIPSKLPSVKAYDPEVNHAPKRKAILSSKEKELALCNALRYFEPKYHNELMPEFRKELHDYGRIYMYRFRPENKIYARALHEYPGKSMQAKAIMLMIHNNLDVEIAQFLVMREVD